VGGKRVVGDSGWTCFFLLRGKYFNLLLLPKLDKQEKAKIQVKQFKVILHHVSMSIVVRRRHLVALVMHWRGSGIHHDVCYFGLLISFLDSND
jgi:hypothetical protein